MQGFLESGPQATLQLSLLFFGSSSKSKHMLIEPHLPTSLNQSIFDVDVDDEIDYDAEYVLISGLNGSSDSIDIFGRVYDKGKDSIFDFNPISISYYYQHGQVMTIFSYSFYR